MCQENSFARTLLPWSAKTIIALGGQKTRPENNNKSPEFWLAESCRGWVPSSVDPFGAGRGARSALCKDVDLLPFQGNSGRDVLILLWYASGGFWSTCCCWTARKEMNVLSFNLYSDHTPVVDFNTSILCTCAPVPSLIHAIFEAAGIWGIGELPSRQMWSASWGGGGEQRWGQRHRNWLWMSVFPSMSFDLHLPLRAQHVGSA